MVAYSTTRHCEWQDSEQLQLYLSVYLLFFMPAKHNVEKGIYILIIYRLSQKKVMQGKQRRIHINISI